jgi:hypothetical protein
MKRWMMLMVVMCAVAVPVARADDASKAAKVQELFTTMHMDHMMDQMMDAITTSLRESLKTIPGADQMTAEQKKLMDDFLTKTLKVANDSVGWSALEPEYVKLYANTYSEEEIDGILTFYKSPAGQAMLAKTPQLTTGSMQIVQARMVDIQPKIKAMQEDFMKQFMATVKPAAKKPAPVKKPLQN